MPETGANAGALHFDGKHGYWCTEAQALESASCVEEGPDAKCAARDPIYRRRRFSPEPIELCVRWYIKYRLSW